DRYRPVGLRAVEGEPRCGEVQIPIVEHWKGTCLATSIEYGQYLIGVELHRISLHRFAESAVLTLHGIRKRQLAEVRPNSTGWPPPSDVRPSFNGLWKPQRTRPTSPESMRCDTVTLVLPRTSHTLLPRPPTVFRSLNAQPPPRCR